jgi:hypothetical protein
MDHVVFWIFLWLIPTLSLNKIKLKLSIRFYCLACHNTLRLQSHPSTFDFNFADGLAVFIAVYAAASAFVAFCVSVDRRLEVGRIAGLGALERREIYCLCWEKNPDSSTFQSVARRYID